MAAVTGVVLDFCVQMNMVLGQRAVYSLDAKSRGRLNALYMTSIFIGGAFGSSVASAVYSEPQISITVTSNVPPPRS